MELCRRVLGPGPLAEEAAAQASGVQSGDRIELLAAAARACRERADRAEDGKGQALLATGDGRADDGLAGAVAREMAAATARLPERQREALALRELLRLSYEQIARVLAIESAAVAPLLARARLKLRAELRGTGEVEIACVDRDRSLRSLARRQDSEPLTSEDVRWLLEHLEECEECDRAHAAMLEASVCYRVA